ncbi:MAG: hypothetical protein ACRDGQ_12710, partial [Candidatus Limnocylindrales bacterium]
PGVAGRRPALARRDAGWPPPTSRPGLARLAGVTLATLILGGGVLYATELTLASGATLSVDPVVTPWARQDPLSSAIAGVAVPVGSAPAQASSAPGPGGSASAGPASSSNSGSRGSSGPPTNLATPSTNPAATPGPFTMDLYRSGDYVGELRDTWCVAAAMQTSMNIMNRVADTSQATQARVFALARSIAPAPDGAAEPEAWATGLGELGYGNYSVTQAGSVTAAIHLAAHQIRLTGRPAGLMVWRGAHSWVMSGFTASADPARTDAFTVLAVRIEDVWYPRLSTIWGYSRPPDSLVPVGELARDYLPWKRPSGTYPDKDGKFVLVIPTP